ncbi:MAG: hypothetical protein R2941_15335 [Desulfobacterales bacterium]
MSKEPGKSQCPAGTDLGTYRKQPYPFLKGKDRIRTVQSDSGSWENLPDYNLGSAEQNLRLLEPSAWPMDTVRFMSISPGRRYRNPGGQGHHSGYGNHNGFRSSAPRVHPRLYANYLKMFGKS